MPKKQEKFVIIDGHALIHRAWHALPPTMRTKDGELVNAVYGFTSILLKVYKELKPDYLAVAFDLPKPTFRHEQYKEYKATRAKQPDELYDQIPRIKEVVEKFGIPIYEVAGFEADDVIATLVRHPSVERCQSVVVTGDMDTLQLVDGNTNVFTMHKGMTDTITYDVAEVKKRFNGLTPSQIVDYKALRGDPSDNIPGVRGIGEKGAITLLNEFKTLEKLYANLDSKKISARYRELLTDQKEQAFMSQKLCRLVDNVPFEFHIDTARVKPFNTPDVVSLFQKLEFKTLISKLPLNAAAIEPSAQGQLVFSDAPAKKTFTDVSYTLVDTDVKFKKFIAEAKKQKQMAIDTETTSLDPFTTELLGVSVSWKDGEAYYISYKKEWRDELGKLLADPKIAKAGHNLKFDIEVLEASGMPVKNLWFDSMIASYLLNPGSRSHSLDGTVFSELGYQMQPITELIGSGKNQRTLKEVPLNEVSDYSCEDADYTWRLIKPLHKQLVEKNNLDLLDKIELPLVETLAEMEKNGIMVDVPFLQTMSKQVAKDLVKIQKKIYEEAGTTFNVASPLQLKTILFDRLGISTQGLGKTKTGISTAAGELEKIADAHPIVKHILTFRELSKLQSTYLEALPELVDAHGRVHTNYNQTIAATGRLSSLNPNLQNIPVRTELGRQIRKAFIAPSGYSLVSADYSQIELRIIASLADDPKMIASFKNGEDIHTRTASEINGVPLEAVTKEMRYAAKATNFGIIYGQGAWGLSESAGISRAEAMDFIDKYFMAYQPIKKYLEGIKEFARKNGYVETFFGRRRYLPEINSSMQMVRAGAERAAINHPIQGTAADLIKIAMNNIHKELPTFSPKSHMLLQVHDELVFEVPHAEVERVSKFIMDHMTGVYTLKAPVEVHVSVGENWGEMKKIEL